MPGCSAAASRELKLANPIAADMSDMRPSLLPGLIAAASAMPTAAWRCGAVRGLGHL
jgi:phenylalanyl-tRNA synthetase beta subunit